MKKNFNPLLFLASLGAGGIAVMPFAFLQYAHPHGKGLITWQEIFNSALVFPVWVYGLLAAVMVVFAAIHFVLSISFFTKLAGLVRTDTYKQLINDPLKNAATLAPFISIAMSMNVVIGPVRFFVPLLAQNLQAIMPYAFVGWVLLLVWLLIKEVRLLTVSFGSGFDVDKIHFGWLLHPFALAMVTVTGTGFAALAHDANIAHMAAFLSLITGTMGMFLFVVKVIALFKKHFASEALPEKHFLPSMLIVLPNVTLFAISLFRFGHYLEHQHGAELGAYFLVVTAAALAFETWYLLFGISLLREYFKTHYFQREYYPTLWAFICPFVAYSVLASFVYSTFVPSVFFVALAVLSGIVAIVFYFDVLSRHIRCAKEKPNIVCE